MRRLAVTIVCIAVLAAATPPLLLAQRRDCRPTRLPEALPAASALVDSAKAIADLATFVQGDRTMMFSLIYHDEDSLPSIRPLDKGDALLAVLLLRSLRPQPPSETWAVRVRVVESRTPQLTIERSVYCPPVAEGRASTVGSVTSTVTSIDLAKSSGAPAENRQIDAVQALVSEDGHALVVRLVGSTGVPVIDEEVMRDYKERRFQPALLDGQPMQAVWRSDGKSPRL